MKKVFGKFIVVITAVLGIAGTARAADTVTAPLEKIRFGSMTCLALSPDSKSFVTGSQDGTARFWDIASGLVTGSIKTNRDNSPYSRYDICGIEYSPDGKQILTVSFMDSLKVWNIMTGECIRNFIASTWTMDFCHSAVFFPNGNNVLLAYGQNAYLMNIATGDTIQKFIGHSASINTVLFSSDGSKIMTGACDTTARLWDVNTGHCLTIFRDYLSTVRYIAMTSDGQKVFTASNFNVISIWDPNSGNRIDTIITPESVYSLSVSTDDKKIVACLWNKEVRIYDISTKKCLDTLKIQTGIPGFAEYSPDGKSIFTDNFQYDYSILQFNASTGVLQKAFKGHDMTNVYSVAFSHDGKKIATGSKDAYMRVWDVNSGNCIGKKTESGFINSIAFLPNDTELFSGSFYFGNVSIWNWCSEDTSPLFNEFVKIVGTSLPYPHPAAISPDGEYVLSLCFENYNAAQLWSVKTNDTVRTFGSHRNLISALAFSPDGARIASGSYDSTIRIWDISSGSSLKVISGKSSSIGSMVFSPDGNKILVGFKGAVRMWDSNSGDSLMSISNRIIGNVTSIAFSSDGTKFLIGDGTVPDLGSPGPCNASLWDINSRTCMKIYKGHNGPVFSVAFSPDGKQIVTGSNDSSAMVWNIDENATPIVLKNKTNKEIQEISLFSTTNRTLTFSNPPTAYLTKASELRLYQLNGRCISIIPLTHSTLSKNRLTVPLPSELGAGMYIYIFKYVGNTQPAGLFAAVK